MKKSGLLAGFPFVLVLLAIAVAWIAWLKIRQDLVRDQQRTRELLEVSAERIQASLQRTIAELENAGCKSRCAGPCRADRGRHRHAPDHAPVGRGWV
jgi:choline-glycine betaine transporter